jgi:putative membrane protein
MAQQSYSACAVEIVGLKTNLPTNLALFFGAHMRKSVAIFGLVLSVSVAGAWAADAPAEVSSTDKKFIEEAASGGSLEVSLGQYAADHATNQDVKDFGKHMDEDHTKANEELRDLAKSKNVELTGTLSTKDKESLDKIEKYEGDKFDKQYVKAMVKDHEKTISTFESEVKDGSDPDIKAWADKTLPTLHHHLDMIKDIQAKM